MRYIVSYSGGKDSTALLLWAIHKYGRNNIIVVAADTGAEFPETFNYFEYVEKHLGIKIHVTKSGKWDFWSYCRHRQKFPDARNRFCYTVRQGITLPELVDKQLRQGKLDLVVGQARG